MTVGMWLSVLERQSADPITWDEIVVGHDFGLLGPDEIRAWAPDCATVAGAPDLRFEEALWAACKDATGKVPRPGGRRWAAAQDRWRLALLQDILAAPLTAEALAVAVESIYERVGCPEDMLGLWRRADPWAKRPGVADRDAIAHFLREKDPGRTKV